MFEAQVRQGSMWKKIIEALKDLVTEANFQCTPEGMSIQAMDTAHVALVNLMLRQDGFVVYNNERTSVLGVNLTSMSKIIKTTETNDVITLRHEDESDVLSIVAQGDAKTSEFNMKLMEIDAETMGIPEIEYVATVSIPSSEFTKICRDMAIFGDTVTVQVTREGVKFSASSDFAEGFVFLKSTANVAAKSGGAAKAEPKAEVKDEDVKTEKKEEVKVENDDSDDDTPLVDQKKFNAKAKDGKDESETPDGVQITVGEPVTLSFALRYFTTFSKGGSLADRVCLYFAEDSPCLIEFKLEGLGYLRFYLAPKVEGQD